MIQADKAMLSILECREILSKAGEHLSDAEVARLRDELYVLAGIAFDAYASKKDDSERQKN